ncbi:uncharacterized protein LOC123685507 isoform X2 [Harmonia axyridis]|uniref:uncharacterized protein LOC123685507 isoform X2 n=1 Tax=Harmonia axyridis TaxID=115357 RepID=UPI001E279ACC|nr:uncharacterized protein LOC123685507 isoform X2 [Harmonia axyridis]
MSWGQWPGPPAQQPQVTAPPASLINPAPSVIPPGMPYNSDQWSQMQQQNWQQWAQWQQQYQQWHQQYGAEYQKSINAMAAQQTVAPNMGLPPPLPVEPQPPLPKEESPKPAPPLPVPVPPPQQPMVLQYSTPPLVPNQFTAPPPSFTPIGAQQSWKSNTNMDQKRPLVGAEGNAPKRQMTNRQQGWQNRSAVPPPPNQNEELSEAEKKFDKQFAEWETQFNKWKEQNSGHPDKQQYKEYEKKWEQWRQQLLDRREAMRRKRLGLPPAKPAQTQNFSVPPPSQAPSAQPPSQPQSGTESKDVSLVTANVFNKPPPDMNNEPLQFKNNNKEPEISGGGLGFLNTEKTDGIPGLDLVEKEDVDNVAPEEHNPVNRGPDLEAISKGINNILGDQKLMNMLSMVSQNQGTTVNSFSNTGGDASSGHDQSNMSIEDSRNDVPEPIQNFDDQTRSSFTLQPNDTEYYRNNSQFGRQGKPPNYYDNESPYNRPPPNFSMPSDDDLKRPPPVKLDNDSFALNKPGVYDRMPPAIKDSFGQRSTTFFPNPETKSNFTAGTVREPLGYGTVNKGRDSFGLRNEREGFLERDDVARESFGMRGRPEFEQENIDGRGFRSRLPLDRDFQGRNSQHINKERRESFDNLNYSGYDRDGRPSQNQKYGVGSVSNMEEMNKYNSPNIMGGRGDYNEAGLHNFNGRSNNFSHVDRSFRKGENFMTDPNDKFEEYANKKLARNQSSEPAMFGSGINRSEGVRFGMNRDPTYGQSTFMDEGDYPPPPKIRGCFGSHENPNLMHNAPEKPHFNRDLLEERFDDIGSNNYVEEADLDIWKPSISLDYDHKSLKPPEIDILVQPFRMFDYRHKPLRRIPFSDRPNWLSDSVKMIPEFDPPIIRQPIIERRMYDERYESNIVRREDRNKFRTDDRYKYEYERKGHDTRFSPPPAKYEENDWSSRRCRSRSPPRFEESSFGLDRERYSWDTSGRSREKIRKEEKRRWEDDDTFRRDRSFDRERRDDRKDRRDEKDRGDDNWMKRDMDWNDKRKLRNREMDLDKLEDDNRNSRFKMDNRNEDPFIFNRREVDSVFPFSKPIDENKSINVTQIDELLNAPGRFNRPQRIVIILRGPPGSGKTYLAKMIKDKEVENGGSTPRILSLDDYFMVEQEKEVIEDGKRIKLKEMVYEFEAEMEESYRNSLMKSFKKTITDGYFPFIIVDDVNDKIKYFGEMWSFAKQNGFQVYICQLDLDIQNCNRRNIHNRKEEEIRLCIEGWENTPSHHHILDATLLLQGESIPEVEMEEISSPISGADENDGSERDLMASANPPAPQELWKNFYSSTMSGKSTDQQSKDRKGSDGRIWKNENNRRR